MTRDITKAATQEHDIAALAAEGKFWEPKKVDGKEPDMNPARAATWDPDRTLEADAIRRLAIGDFVPDNAGPASTRPLLIKGAHIHGELNPRGATVTRGIWLEHCFFDDIVQLSDSRTKTFSFRGSMLSQGLRAKRAVIKGSLYLNDGFIAENEVNLEDVTIEGNLECSNGKFRKGEREATEWALMADNAKIAGDVRLDHDKETGSKTGFKAKGEVRFVGAKVAGDFNCDGGQFHNGKEMAISADGLSCRNLFARSGFEAKGTANFIGVHTVGQFSCVGGKFKNKGNVALKLRFAEIGSSLFFDEAESDNLPNPHATIRGKLDLSHATCRIYRDSEKSWPPPDKLLLDGFTYECFSDCPTDWRTRQKWLKLQKPDLARGSFHPQPWTQVIKVLRDMGADVDSRQLAVCREAELARSNRWTISLERGTWKQPLKIFTLWDVFLHYAVGYGYKPWHAFYWSVGFFAFGWLTFATAANLGYMAPRQSGAHIYLENKGTPPLPVHYTQFDAPLYTLDVFLPIVELGQDETWEPTDKPTGQSQGVQGSSWTQTVRLALGQDWSVNGTPAESDETSMSGLAVLTTDAFSVGVHRLVYWAVKILGWIFVSLFIAGMSGIMKKE